MTTGKRGLETLVHFSVSKDSDSGRTRHNISPGMTGWWPVGLGALCEKWEPVFAKTMRHEKTSIVRKVGTGFRKNNATEQKVRSACLRQV